MPNAPSLPGLPPQQRGGDEPPGGRPPADGMAAAPDGRFRALVDALLNLAFETDTHGAMSWCSAGWERFTGLAAPALNGQGWLRVVHPEDLAGHAAEWARRLGRLGHRRGRDAGGRACRAGAGRIHARGHQRRLDAALEQALAARGQVVCGEQGEVQRMVGVNLDITAQKTAQAALAEALQAEDTLLYEVNHRVKNNLQVISSLLSLQLRSVRDADARRAIEQASARVDVMARLHLELYQSGRHGDLDLARWLQRLAQDQLRLLGHGRAIALDYQADTTLSLAVDQAVPLSLMVSELLTNALKYAFPDGRGGTVRLQLRRAGHGVQLLVADDGVGLPPQLEPEGGAGLGLRIVHALARQIDARLELLERRDGVAFRIELPLAGEAAAG